MSFIKTYEKETQERMKLGVPPLPLDVKASEQLV